ncbi:hypothetical protein OQA88_5982 [Cercophora sp. LCS_1]
MMLPTILLIHGAWHTPATYAKLTDSLESYGYNVHIPRLPSLDEVSERGLTGDIAHVRSVASSLLAEGRRLVVIMHSYGGQVGTSALAGLGPGVLHLIYMCAFAIPRTTSLFEQTQEAGAEELIPLVFDIGEDGTVAVKDVRTMFFGEVRGEEVEEYVGTLVERWDGSGMFERGTGEAWKEVSVTYVVTTDDKMLDVSRQKKMIEDMRAQGSDVSVVELKDGHCPNLTSTEDIVKVVRSVKVE